MKNEKKVEVIPYEIKQEVPESIYLYGHDYIREDKCDKVEREYNREFIKVNGKEYMSVECHNAMDMIRMDKYEKHEYKLGDVVRLKSGSPKMTIAKIDKRENGTLIHTIWFDEDVVRPEQRIGSFEDIILEKVEKEHIGCDGCELDCDEVDCDMCKEDKNIYLNYCQSDEFIERAAQDYASKNSIPLIGLLDYIAAKNGFIYGIKWYKELTK